MVSVVPSFRKSLVMESLPNPFHENYITETTSPSDFVDVFSPLHLSETLDTLALFQPGNVILTGAQGSGKSMLLALLKPEIRLAYVNREATFPVPVEFSKFIGAGINLTRSGCCEFGQRAIAPGQSDDQGQLPLLFGDFLNYWIVRDILNSVATMGNNRFDGSLHDAVSIEPDTTNQFATSLAAHDCWFDYLSGVATWDELVTKLNERIQVYRGFMNYNCELSDEITHSKTRVGEPISVTAEILRSVGVVAHDVEIYVRIDQYEELVHLEEWSQTKGLYDDYCAVIHKMLARRDHRVSYRIGTRRYAWPDTPRIFGTAAFAEDLRNFKKIDLDDILCRQENRPWLFPKFAGDVFTRRVQHAGYEAGTIRDVFGTPMDDSEKAKRYAGADPENVLALDSGWFDDIKEILKKCARIDPLSAKLGEAWVRQQLERRSPSLPTNDSCPWEAEDKWWWRKERIEQALLQIAARKKQKLIWSGDDDIINVSASNVLAFVDVCQYIWAAWLRSFPERDAPRPPARKLPSRIDHEVQNEGIQLASAHWYRKIRGEQRGDSRRRFVRNVGYQFRTLLRDDKKMTYPGYNGFSVPLHELDEDTEIASFLKEAAAFGVLVERRHTSRTRGRGECRKYYLQPILCPYFQIPAVHTKEPLEVHSNDVRGWLIKAEVLRPSGKTVDQPVLFDLHGEDE
jgi:hypothetical protein